MHEYKAGDRIVDNKRDITILRIYKDTETGKKVYDYKCNKCTYEGIRAKYDKLVYRNLGCQCCCPNSKKNIPGKNTVGAKVPGIIKYLVDPTDADKYLAGSKKLVMTKCPICGNTKTVSVASLVYKGYSCAICGRNNSKANKLFSVLLRDLQIVFEREKTFSWANRRLYDFYLPEYSAIVELNGSQHYLTSKFGAVEKQLQNDCFKQTVALDNGIKKYLQIDCSQCEGNLQKLAELLLTTLQDFLGIRANFSIKTLLEHYCKEDSLYEQCLHLFLSGINSAAEISRKLGYSDTYILKILNTLTTLGYIDYKGRETINAKRRKKVIDQTTNIVYDSVMACSQALNIARSSIRYNKKRFKIE